MKATMLAKSCSLFFCLIFLDSMCSAAVCRHKSSRCCSFLFFLTNFLSFHLSGVFFYINKFLLFIYQDIISHRSDNKDLIVLIRNHVEKESTDITVTEIKRALLLPLNSREISRHIVETFWPHRHLIIQKKTHRSMLWNGTAATALAIVTVERSRWQ